MIVNIFHYNCDKCDKGYQVAQIPRFYESKDLSLRIGCRPAWCVAEKTMVEAEDFGDLNEFQETLEILQVEAEEFGNDGDVDIEEWRQRIGWRRSRRSPRRCLACGSVDIVLAPQGSESSELHHPSCGGVLSVRRLDVKDLGVGILRYSTEGLRLA